MSISIEKLYEIWDDDIGQHYEVWADRDGLDLVEIRYYAFEDKESQTRVTMTRETAAAIVKALTEYLCLPK